MTAPARTLSDGFVLPHLADPRPDDEAELEAALRARFLGRKG